MNNLEKIIYFVMLSVGHIMVLSSLFDDSIRGIVLGAILFGLSANLYIVLQILDNKNEVK